MQERLKSSLESARLAIEEAIKLAGSDLTRDSSNAVKESMMSSQKHLNESFPALKVLRRNLFLLQPGESPEGVRNAS